MIKDLKLLSKGIVIGREQRVSSIHLYEDFFNVVGRFAPMVGTDNRKPAIVVNSLIIIFVAYSMLNLVFQFVKVVDFGTFLHPLLYYTNWSNILSAAAAACYLFCIFKGVRMPKAIAVLKLASVMMLTVTFLVVVFILCPQLGWAILYDVGGMIFLHLIVPVLAVIDILLLADIDEFGRRDVFLAVMPMICYAIGIVIILLVTGSDDLAPYPFLRIHSQPVYETVLWFIGLFLLGLGLSYMYSRLVKRFNSYVAGN